MTVWADVDAAEVAWNRAVHWWGEEHPRTKELREKMDRLYVEWKADHPDWVEP